MKRTVKIIRDAFLWLDRSIALSRASEERRLADYVERRRRDLVRRTAERMGSD